MINLFNIAHNDNRFCNIKNIVFLLNTGFRPEDLETKMRKIGDALLITLDTRVQHVLQYYQRVGYADEDRNGRDD